MRESAIIMQRMRAVRFGKQFRGGARVTSTLAPNERFPSLMLKATGNLQSDRTCQQKIDELLTLIFVEEGADQSKRVGGFILKNFSTLHPLQKRFANAKTTARNMRVS